MTPLGVMCISKIRLTNERGETYEVPCGHCPECIQQRRAEWTGRNMVELKHSARAYHVTYTFEEPLKIANDEFDYYSYFDFWIPKRCVYQKLLKRMRKKYNFKYFGAFEFGSNSYRPHYHIIFYFKEDIELSEDDFKQFWPYGIITVDNVEQASCHYLTKDLMKYERVVGYSMDFICRMPKEVKRDMLFKRLLYKRGFNFMSIRPAIGAQLLDDKEFVHFVRQYYDDFDTFPMLCVEGQKFPFPRYYVKKLFPNLDLMDAMIERNKQAAKKLAIDKGGEVEAFLYNLDHAENAMREYEAYLKMHEIRKQI